MYPYRFVEGIISPLNSRVAIPEVSSDTLHTTEIDTYRPVGISGGTLLFVHPFSEAFINGTNRCYAILPLLVRPDDAIVAMSIPPSNDITTMAAHHLLTNFNKLLASPAVNSSHQHGLKIGSTLNQRTMAKSYQAGLVLLADQAFEGASIGDCRLPAGQEGQWDEETFRDHVLYIDRQYAQDPGGNEELDHRLSRNMANDHGNPSAYKADHFATLVVARARGLI